MQDGQSDVELLTQRLTEGDALLARWMDVICRHSWQLRGGKSEKLELLGEHCRRFLDTLAATLHGAVKLEIGTPGFREPVQSLSFTAGWMAGAGLTVTDAVALVHGLEEVLQIGRSSFFQSLIVVVTEAFASSLVQRERARYRDAMEKSQVVCDPHPRLPCLFLVGDPDRQALEDAVGRVMMLAVMRDARVVLVDCCALQAPDKVLPMACTILAEHSQAATIQVVLGGVSPLQQRDLRAIGGGEMQFYESHSDAIGGAMSLAGLAWQDLGPRS